METKKIIKKTQTIKKQSPKVTDGIEVFDITGKSIDTLSLNKDVFEHKDNPELISQYIRVYNHNQRQGTASTKTRGEIAGTTKKIYRQKGTGRARHGAAKANLFVGGGVTFGPMPKNYSLNMNKKQKKKALFISLSIKNKAKQIIVLNTKGLGKDPKTSVISKLLLNLKLIEKKVLFILSKVEKTPFLLSSRNLELVSHTQASTINPYEVLNNNQLIFVDDALDTFYSHFLKKNEN